MASALRPDRPRQGRVSDCRRARRQSDTLAIATHRRSRGGFADATKLPDGRIVVVNTGTYELRVLDAAGIRLATWGGQGEGPGEFNYRTSADRWPGDSIVAWSAPRMGMSVFDADGNYGRTFRLEDVGARFWPDAAAVNSTIMAVHAPEGGLSSSFGMARDGSLERIVRHDLVRRAPTQADIEADIDRRLPIHGLPDAEADSVRAELRPRYEGAAEYLPAFGSIMADASAHLRVEEYESVTDDFAEVAARVGKTVEARGVFEVEVEAGSA